MAANPPRIGERNATLGVSLAVTAGLALSTGPLLLRSIETASGWQVLIYRCAAFTLFLLLIIMIQHRGRIVAPFRAIGKTGLLIALAMGSGFATYVFAILYTSVANAMFVLASSPILSAILARIVLGERLKPVLWGMIFIAMAGIGIMVASDLSTDRLLGNAMAFATACFFAIIVVLIRRESETDMLPATCLSGVVALIIALVCATSWTISQHDLIISIIFGTAQIGIGFLCFTYAPRYILAAEVALIALLEPVLAPIWVWIAYGETPTGATLIGGSLVLGCIIAFTLTTLAEQRARINA